MSGRSFLPLASLDPADEEALLQRYLKPLTLTRLTRVPMDARRPLLDLAGRQMMRLGYSVEAHELPVLGMAEGPVRFLAPGEFAYLALLVRISREHVATIDWVVGQGFFVPVAVAPLFADLVAGSLPRLQQTYDGPPPRDDAPGNRLGVCRLAIGSSRALADYLTMKSGAVSTPGKGDSFHVVTCADDLMPLGVGRKRAQPLQQLIVPPMAATPDLMEDPMQWPGEDHNLAVNASVLYRSRLYRCVFAIRESDGRTEMPYSEVIARGLVPKPDDGRPRSDLYRNTRTIKRKDRDVLRRVGFPS